MRSSHVFALAAVLATALAVLVPGAFGGPSGTATGVWFVELKGAPAADGGDAAALKAEKAAFRAAATKAGAKFKERYAFDTLWNGVSVEASSTSLATIQSLDAVQAVYPVLEVELPAATPESDPDLFTAKAMTGADVAQSELGYTGRGVRAAVMDTGIDWNHPDLGGCFGAGCKVVGGWDFVGDTFNADTSSPNYQPVPTADANPDDCQGHGTHVAGILGANGAITGVAPGVSLAAYRVFGCDGSTTSDIMVAAMERVLADGNDLLNMSIGAAFNTWPQYPTAAAAERLVNKGVIVVTSAGNSGADGMWSTGAPGVANKAIASASFQNTHVASNAFRVTPGGELIPYLTATTSPPAPVSGSLPMSKTGTPTTNDDACAPLPAGSLTGTAVLVRRGTCAFVIKNQNVIAAGAEAMVIYNNQPGTVNPNVTGTTIPVVSIVAADGATLDARIAAGPTTLTWTPEVVTTANPLGGQVAGSSSFGLNAELTLKPDVGAPGANIRSTYPVEKGSYANLSGTSMASPHTGGAVALLLEAHGKLSWGEIRARLQNNADPRNKIGAGNAVLGLDNVQRQGAGMLDVDDAITATTVVEPSKLSLGESEAGPATRTLTIANRGSTAQTYGLSHEAALSTAGSTFAPTFPTEAASVSFSEAGVPTSSVTVPAGASAAVDATITAPAALAERGVYGGYLKATDSSGRSFRVPYAGLKGDYQSFQILVPTAAEFPWLARHTGFVSATDLTAVHTKAEPNPAFTMGSSTHANGRVMRDVPYVAAHLDFQVRRARIELFEAGTNRRVGLALEQEYIGRDSTNAGTQNTNATSVYTDFELDGTVKKGNGRAAAPNGTYYAVLSVQKPLGANDNPAHWERWTSPTFRIARP